MSSLSRNARIAGFLYLGAILLGPVRLIYIPSVLFVTGNAAAARRTSVAVRGISSRTSRFRFSSVRLPSCYG